LHRLERRISSLGRETVRHGEAAVRNGGRGLDERRRGGTAAGAGWWCVAVVLHAVLQTLQNLGVAPVDGILDDW